MRLMMLVVLLLAACSGRPAKPDAKAFDAMTPEQKCDVTFPRAKTCLDELMVAELRSLVVDSGEMGDALERDLGGTPTYKDEAEAMHKQSCLGSVDDGYTRGIVRCWDVEGCKAFAQCVFPPPAEQPAGSARPKARIVE